MDTLVQIENLKAVAEKVSGIIEYDRNHYNRLAQVRLDQIRSDQVKLGKELIYLNDSDHFL